MPSIATLSGRDAATTCDDLVVGAGFAGAVVAERLAAAGRQVVVVDRRPHIGGNAYDELDDAGILVHRYGPHIFHTNAPAVVAYLSRFTEWRPYEHRVLASVRGKLLPIPINLDTLNRLFGMSMDEEAAEAFLAARAEPIEHPRTSEDVVLARVGRELYELFFRGYTRKQWGMDPADLDASVTARIPVRTNRDDRYFTDAFQAMPSAGYTAMFERMLTHPNIRVLLGQDWRWVDGRLAYRRLIYSGPVDDFFDQRFDPLPYRSLQFEFETVDREWVQPVATVNFPNERAYTRQTEFKHLTGQRHARSSLVREFPTDEGDPYYPVPMPSAHAQYARYAELAAGTQNVHFVGRLATYRYYNMDQVVAQALTLAKRLVADGNRPAEHRRGAGTAVAARPIA